jgi:hypothetical protein
MSYFDWDRLVKPLKFQPVDIDTTCNPKATEVIPVDYVKTGFVQLKIPAFDYTPIYNGSGPLDPPHVPVGSPRVPLIVAQFNYSVPVPITIINPRSIGLSYNNSMSGPFIVLAIRFRVGNVVTRYLLDKTLSFVDGGSQSENGFNFPVYTNETILGNFVIELWQTATAGQLSLLSDIMLQTGIIFFPNDWEDTANVIAPVQYVPLNLLETSLPETVPTAVDPAGPWLTN